MFADGWGGSSAESRPAPAGTGGGLTPELIESCRESTRRAERIVERFAPARREVEPTDPFEELGWAISAMEAQAPESDH